MGSKKKNRRIVFILIFLFCVVILYSALLLASRYNKKRTIENSEDLENTIEMNGYGSEDDLANQALVEESNEVKESDEAKKSDKVKEFDATEEFDDTEGAARVFNHWLDFSGSSFSEDLCSNRLADT